MAEPGDPPPSSDHDHDDLIGFTSAASLAPARRTPEPEPLTAASLDADPDQGGLFDPPVNRVAALRARHAPASTPPATASTWPDDDGVSIPPAYASADRTDTFGRAPAVKPARVEGAEGGMGLFAVYALILFAVPTLGVAAAVALVAVTVRPWPDQALARSHFDFQKRTLWIAAIAAVLGVVLIAVNLGVFVLFLLAVWMLARGAWGLVLLARGEPIKRPNQWLIAAR